MVSIFSKRLPWWSNFALEKKSHRMQVQINKESFQCSDVLQGHVYLLKLSMSIVEVKQPLFFLLQISSLLVHLAKHMPQDLFVDTLIDRRGLWQKLAMDMPLSSKNMINMTSSFWVWLSLASATSETFTDTQALGFWIVFKNLCLDAREQIWFILKTPSDFLTHLHAELLLNIIQQSWYHFFTLTVRMFISSMIIF